MMKKWNCFFDVFFKELWHKYDQGVYLKEDLIELGSSKLPEYKNEITNMMNESII